MVEVFETIEKLREETLLDKGFILLVLSKLLTGYLLMSIAELARKWTICEVKDVKAEKENCLFPKSLLGVTIQDSGMTERRDAIIPCYTSLS